MSQIVPDEGLIAVLDTLNAAGVNASIYLDTVNTPPAAADVFANIIQPTDLSMVPQVITTPVSTGASGAEQYTYAMKTFGPLLVGGTDIVYAWCIVIVDPTAARRILFRRQLPSPVPLNFIGITISITPSIGAATA